MLDKEKEITPFSHFLLLFEEKQSYLYKPHACTTNISSTEKNDKTRKKTERNKQQKGEII